MPQETNDKNAIKKGKQKRTKNAIRQKCYKTKKRKQGGKERRYKEDKKKHKKEALKRGPEFEKVTKKEIKMKKGKKR